MSMTYGDIKRMVRFEEKDNSKVKFSDYDIKLAVNKVLRYISNAQALQNSDFMEKTAEYDEDTINATRVAAGEEEINFATDGVDLPTDFVSLISAVSQVAADKGRILRGVIVEALPRMWEYKITQGKIYTGCKTFTLHYKKNLSSVSADTDIIALPDTYLDDVVNLVRMALNGDNAAFTGAVGALVDQLVPRRRYRNMKIHLPWKV